MITEPTRSPNEPVVMAPAGQSVVAGRRDQRRRRLLGAAGGVGVLLSVQAKTALGQTCISMSGMMSGNTSPHSDHEIPCAAGLSPGFWKQPQHFNEWPKAGATAPTFDSGGGNAGAQSATGTSSPTLTTESGATQPMAIASLDPTASTMTAAGGKKPPPGLGQLGNMIDPGTLVADVLPGAPVAPLVGIWEVLYDPLRFEPNGQLMRHLIAAWMNAAAVANYPLTQMQVQDIWSQLRDTGSYCPPAITCSTPLGPEEVKQYIESTYHSNEE